MTDWPKCKNEPVQYPVSHELWSADSVSTSSMFSTFSMIHVCSPVNSFYTGHDPFRLLLRPKKAATVTNSVPKAIEVCDNDTGTAKKMSTQATARKLAGTVQTWRGVEVRSRHSSSVVIWSCDLVKLLNIVTWSRIIAFFRRRTNAERRLKVFNRTENFNSCMLIWRPQQRQVA